MHLITDIRKHPFNLDTAVYAVLLVIETIAGAIIVATNMGKYGDARIWTLVGIGMTATSATTLWQNSTDDGWAELYVDSRHRLAGHFFHLRLHLNRWVFSLASLYSFGMIFYYGEMSWATAMGLFIMLVSLYFELRWGRLKDRLWRL